MAVDQFVNSKISLAHASRWAAGQGDAIARHQARVHEPEQRAPVLEVADQGAFDVLDAAAPKPCGPLPSSNQMRNTNSTCSSGISDSPAIRASQNDPAQTLRRPPSKVGYPPPPINQPS
jgi:hypothetical protein